MNTIATETATVYDIWKLHPRYEELRAYGCDCVAPPRHLNLSLTNKCNLRCTICGSQSWLGQYKMPRHHMDIGLFRTIAETLFPLLYEVELNSLGEPLLYPHIDEVFEAMARHNCAYFIQHNGSLLDEQMVERLTRGYGTLSLSIDATGDLFEAIRLGNSWQKVRDGIGLFAKRRDKNRQALMFYPTVTRRSCAAMLDVVRFAHENEVTRVTFHDYNVIADSIEEVPVQQEKAAQIALIQDFLSREMSHLHVYDGAREVYRNPATPCFTCERPDRLKEKFAARMNYPVDAKVPDRLCPAPTQSVDVSLYGDISLCSHAQHNPLGRLTSFEEFARIWFGANYEKIRKSLRREVEGTRDLPMPACLGCISSTAPNTAKTCCSITYNRGVSDHPEALEYDAPTYVLTGFRTEVEEVPYYSVLIPHFLRLSDYTLFENETPLAAEPDEEKAGSYKFKNNYVYVRATDDTNPGYNGRRYELRRNE